MWRSDDLQAYLTEIAKMTIQDFLKLIKRHLKFIIALPVIFALMAIGWHLVSPSGYTATASFVTNGDLAFAQGLANKEAASYSNSAVRITCTSQSSAKQITVSASGPDSSVCIESANAVVKRAAEQYQNTSGSSILVTITEATMATSDAPSPVRTVLIAFVLGLLISLCIIVLLDALETPLRSRGDIEGASGLLILGDAPSSDGGDRLLANLQFRCNGRPSTISVVPVGIEATAPVVARELTGALERSDVRVRLVKGSPHAKKFQVSVPEDAAIVVSCEPLDVGMGAAYIAHNADATVLCVSEWTDSRKQLTATIQELELAKANIAGIVCLPEQKQLKQAKESKSE